MHTPGQEAAHALLDVGFGVDVSVAVGALLDDHVQEVDVASSLLSECKAFAHRLDELLLDLGAWCGRNEQVVDIHKRVQHCAILVKRVEARVGA